MTDSTPEYPQPRIVDVPTARHLLGGVGRNIVYRLMGDRDVDRVKVGGRTFITVESIDRFLARQIADGRGGAA